jgi:primosomal protein N' (replication factor Y) (superfamily II helicase)
VPQPTQPNLFDGEATPAPTGLFADVIFERPLDHAYSYAVPPHLAEQIAVGKRIWAPFGKGDKATLGYCVRLSHEAPERAVKSILRVLDEEILLNENLLRLTRWMADYYLCSWGQVLSAIVPAGARHQAGTRATTLIEVMADNELPSPLPKLSPKQTAALERLRDHGKPIPMRSLAKLARCGLNPVQGLVKKGLARRVRRRVERFTLPDDEAYERSPVLHLNADQLQAWSALNTATTLGGYHTFLLHGVTGSGKTELYLRAIDQVVRQGKQALVLVPEISLTPQTIHNFRGRLGEVAVLHSHLSNAERGSQWRRIIRGEVSVIVGARSAIFAPANNLGLIVIDEEHEGSFKQESTPRYHARDVAVMRARLENIPIVLGSATPSLESWHNAQRGAYTLLHLPKRVMERPLPRVALIDMRTEMPRGRGFQALSPSLEKSMHYALKDGGQVLLLLNRRGFSTHIHCPSCGYVASCRFCDLALTFHRHREAALCHYCGYEEDPLVKCPKCGQEQVRYYGLGTEKLQSEVESKFPGFVSRRMDSDTMKRPGSHGRLLAEFRKGDVHILLGTQMIAKGLDFPNVTLVGVVNADVGLHLPDFRSAERTFQLLAQVAGRTGRGPRGGRVLVQTFNPEHPSIALAATHDYLGFVVEELRHRRQHQYPPYQRLVRLIVRGRVQEDAAAFADQMAAAFHGAMENLGVEQPAELRLLGPAEAPVFRLKGYHRYHFQLQSASSATLHRVIRAALPGARPPQGVEYTLDVDPLNML